MIYYISEVSASGFSKEHEVEFENMEEYYRHQPDNEDNSDEVSFLDNESPHIC